MKALLVGDMHCQISNLDESYKLIRFICQEACAYNVDTIIFLGDQFHNHSVLRLEVISFWRAWALPQLVASTKKVVFMVGNHDICGDKQKERTMSANDIFEGVENVIVTSKPMKINGVSFIPFTSDKEQFVREAIELNGGEIGKTLICHQTFNGAQYENGFYAPEGLDQLLLPYESIVSGHVHLSSQIGKVKYIGSPRWMSMNDANSKKHIAIADFSDGRLLRTEYISTEHVCTPIISLTVKEGDKLPEINVNARNHIELIGSTAWITKTKKKLPDSVHIKVSPTDRVITKIERKKGLNLMDFASTFDVTHGIIREEMIEVLQEVGLGTN